MKQHEIFAPHNNLPGRKPPKNWGEAAGRGSLPTPLLLIFRQLNGVKLRLEEGGVGWWAMGGPGESPGRGYLPEQLAEGVSPPCFFPHLLFTFRPLSGVKLRLEKGGRGSGARERAQARALSWAQAAGPEGRKKLPTGR